MTYLDDILATLGLPHDLTPDEFRAVERWTRDPQDLGRARVVSESTVTGALFPLTRGDRDKLLKYAARYWRSLLTAHTALSALGLQGQGNPPPEAKAAAGIEGLTAKHKERVLRAAYHKRPLADRPLPEYLPFDPRDYEVWIVEGAEHLVAVELEILPKPARFAGALRGGRLGLGQKLGRMLVGIPGGTATWFPVSIRSSWRRLRDRAWAKQILEADRNLSAKEYSP